jgi:hypothetical protein
MELFSFLVMLIFALMAWACERIIWLLLIEEEKENAGIYLDRLGGE